MYILTKQYNGPLSYSDEYPLYWCDMYIYTVYTYAYVIIGSKKHTYIYTQYIYNIHMYRYPYCESYNLTYYYWYCYLIILYHYCSKPQHRQALAAAARGFNALERREVSNDAWSLVEQPVKQTNIYIYIYICIYTCVCTVIEYMNMYNITSTYYWSLLHYMSTSCSPAIWTSCQWWLVTSSVSIVIFPDSAR